MTQKRAKKVAPKTSKAKQKLTAKKTAPKITAKKITKAPKPSP